MGVRLPAWWDYPAQCERRHPWGPGLVLVGWKSCNCPPVLEAGGPAGHTVVYCRAEGCRSRWYRPRHEPERDGPGLAGLRREAAITWTQSAARARVGATSIDIPQENLCLVP